MKIKPIKAAGGAVFRINPDQTDPEILLIFRNGYWDLPKGKLEKGESLAMCAVREVAEEVGVDLPMIITRLGDSYHEYEEKGTRFGKTTSWYVMCFGKTQDMTPQEKEGIEAVQWVGLSEATEKVGFDNLKGVLSEVKAWFDRA